MFTYSLWHWVSVSLVSTNSTLDMIQPRTISKRADILDHFLDGTFLFKSLELSFPEEEHQQDFTLAN